MAGVSWGPPGSSLTPFFSLAESVMMNGSNLASTTASSPKSKEDQVVNGHDEKENNPIAEYMWMENEEDFNRQVGPGRGVASSVFPQLD